jgi:hypothetical protein
MKNRNNFFASLKSLKKGVGSGVGSGSGSVSQRYVRIRTKMSRIPNTDHKWYDLAKKRTFDPKSGYYLPPFLPVELNDRQVCRKFIFFQVPAPQVPLDRTPRSGGRNAKRRRRKGNAPSLSPGERNGFKFPQKIVEGI